jgi:hypothetical protein
MIAATEALNITDQLAVGHGGVDKRGNPTQKGTFTGFLVALRAMVIEKLLSGGQSRMLVMVVPASGKRDKNNTERNWTQTAYPTSEFVGTFLNTSMDRVILR